jgi:hypothetical protein
MRALDSISIIIVVLCLIIFFLYVFKTSLFVTWKYKKYLINIPIVLTVGIVIAYSLVLNQRKKVIEQEYKLIKQTIDSISTSNEKDSIRDFNKDSLKILTAKENQLITSEKEVNKLINEKEKIDKRIGADRAIIDSLNKLQIQISGKLSKIQIEKDKYYKKETRYVKSGGKFVKTEGKFLVVNVNVFNCLYNIENLTLNSVNKEISSTQNANVSLNLKYTITENKGEIYNKTVDSLIFLSFKLPNGMVVKNENKKCLSHTINKEFSDCIRFDKLPYDDSVKFLIDISKIDTGIYYIEFFTKDCNICEYTFKF